MRSVWLGVALAICLIVPLVTLAVDDEFRVSQFVQTDFTPPSTPSIASTTPVSFSQIDVSWSTSTDNTSVSGYELFRDAVHIATTTLTTYSDTGLTASTTYSYTVRAFDIAFNYSTTSAAVATTTLQIPPTPTTTATVTPPVLTSSLLGRSGIIDFNLTIETTPTTAAFSWQTNDYALFTLRWGRTTSYELGYVASDVLAISHQTLIDQLEPGTTYEYELFAVDRNGREHILSRDQFTTKPGADVTPPPNVTNVTAVRQGSDVALSWINPQVPDFATVRVVRSHLFFPADPHDGFVVFQGDGEAALDRNPFVLGPIAFYAIFSFDASDNVSSGAVVAVHRELGVIAVSDIPRDLLLPPGRTTTPVPLTPEEQSLLDQFSFTDVAFYQDGQLLSPDVVGEYSIEGVRPLLVAVPYEVLPEHLKTITVSLAHPSDPEYIFSFLLRVNKDKTAYEAEVAPLELAGRIKTTVDIFDFKREILHQVYGYLVSQYVAITKFLRITPGFLTPHRVILLITFGLVLLALIAFLRRRSNNNRQPTM